MKKVLIISMNSPALDRKSWSGVPFSICSHLKDDFDFSDVYVKPHNTFWGLVRCGISRFVFRKNIPLRFTIAYARKVSAQIKRELNRNHYDCIFCFNNPGAIAFLNTNVPIVYMSDCVTSSIIDYYWFNIGSLNKREMNYITKKALDRAEKIVFSSEWAKRAAINDYNIPESKISIIHFGANTEVKDFIHKEHDGINLLFVGVEWERKGGEIAVDCVNWLNKMDSSFHYRLHLVGCKPPEKIVNNDVIIYGFLNRENDSERKKLEELRSITDLFILPTKAECAGIVFCEASAYSIPSITYDTGGIGDYVINGENGYRLPVGRSGRDFAEEIIKIIHDNNKMDYMKKRSYDLYAEEYNWDVASKKIKDLLLSIHS